MGNGIVREAQDFESFKKFSAEYDRMRLAGLSAEEIHGILISRIQKTQSIISNEAVDFSQIKDIITPGLQSNGLQSAQIKSPSTATAEKSNNGNITHSSSISPVSSNVENTPSKPIAPSKPVKAKTIGLALLIDDSAVAAKVASKILISANFDVVSANSAKMGFDILLNRKDEIDVIFLDVVMPNVDGVECLTWIKDNAEVSHIPVYMLSGLEDQMLAEVCIERGAEGMLLKPLNLETVKTIVRSHGIGGNEDNLVPVEDNLVTKTSEQSNNIPRPTPINTDQVSKTSNVPTSSNSTTETTTNNVSSGRAKKNSPTPVLNHPYTNIAAAPQPNTSIGGLVPAFKLVDSDFDEYIYPSTSGTSSKKLSLLLFIPTVYCPQLYEEDGFLMRFFHNYDMLMHTKQVTVACVSGDLPFALAAAKQRFRIPFTLLSDPSLFVTQKIVGCINMGPVLAYQELRERYSEDSDDESDEENESSRNKRKPNPKQSKKNELDEEVQQQILSVASHYQQTFYAPRLGMLLLNRRREILNLWLCPLPAGAKSSSPVGAPLPFNPKDISLRQFPNNFKDWITQISNGGTTKGTTAEIDDTDDADVSPQHNRNQHRHSSISSTNSNPQSNKREAEKQHGHFESKEREREHADKDYNTNVRQQRRSRDSIPTSSVPVAPIVDNTIATPSLVASIPEKTAILVIDDSSVSSRVVCKKLESLGYAVNAAYDGQKGFDMLKKKALNYSIVLCDVVMPICDGIGFLKLIKSDEETKNIPVVMLSGLEGEELSKSCIDLGAYSLLKKPFDEQRFSEIVGELGIHRPTK